MYARLNSAEGTALHGLIEEAVGDIVVRIDGLGFIETASSNITQIGQDPSQLLLKPHLTDLTKREFGPQLRNYIAMVISGRSPHRGDADWIEFPIDVPGEENAESGRGRRVWYALSLRPIMDDRGAVTGALGLLRASEKLQRHGKGSHPRAMIDPLTGLASRHAFCLGLGRILDAGIPGTLAMFEIDHLRAITLEFGQQKTDELIWAFSRFLTTMANSECELGQLDSGRFCVVLPSYCADRARIWVQDVLDTLAALATTENSRRPRLTASAGLAPIGNDIDWVLRQCEVGLVMARARGELQVGESCRKPALVARYRGGEADQRHQARATVQMRIAL